jgi:hypothetical protein
MIEFKPFSQQPQLWGRTETTPFSTDTSDEPLFAEFIVNGRGTHLRKFGKLVALAIIDGCGLEVDICDSKGESHANVRFEGAYATRAAVLLEDGMAYQQLIALPGAQPITL